MVLCCLSRLCRAAQGVFACAYDHVRPPRRTLSPLCRHIASRNISTGAMTGFQNIGPLWLGGSSLGARPDGVTQSCAGLHPR